MTDDALTHAYSLCCNAYGFSKFLENSKKETSECHSSFDYHIIPRIIFITPPRVFQTYKPLVLLIGICQDYIISTIIYEVYSVYGLRSFPKANHFFRNPARVCVPEKSVHGIVTPDSRTQRISAQAHALSLQQQCNMHSCKVWISMKIDCGVLLPWVRKPQDLTAAADRGGKSHFRRLSPNRVRARRNRTHTHDVRRQWRRSLYFRIFYFFYFFFSTTQH